jgi:hypothetical protein
VVCGIILVTNILSLALILTANPDYELHQIQEYVSNFLSEEQ